MRAFLLLIAFCSAAAIAIKLAAPEKPVAAPVVAVEKALPAAQLPAAEKTFPRASDSPFRTPPETIAVREPAPKAISASVPARPPVRIPDADAENDAPCTDLLAADIAVVQLSASASALSGNAVCGDEAPARMTAVKMRDGSLLQFTQPVISNCKLALEFARWVRDDLAEAARFAKVTLRRINIASSYSCRPVNNIKGQKLSEHGRANAVDVSAVTLSNNRTYPIFSPDLPGIFLAAMRASACERFTTVLGPGADAAHADHIHVDLAQRRGGYRICQWNMPAWPLP